MYTSESTYAVHVSRDRRLTGMAPVTRSKGGDPPQEAHVLALVSLMEVMAEAFEPEVQSA